jgi:ferredoxin
VNSVGKLSFLVCNCENMSIVDKDKCITCGLCFSVHSDLFILGADGKAEAAKQPQTPEEEAAFVEAMGACPVDAIAE